jgi:hypothetical protein
MYACCGHGVETPYIRFYARASAKQRKEAIERFAQSIGAGVAEY